MSKELESKSLFAPNGERKTGIGYHNLPDVLSSSSAEVLRAIQYQYGARCGHVPITGFGESIVMVREHDARAGRHFDYLSTIYKRTITPMTHGEIALKAKNETGQKMLAVPYINHPDAENKLKQIGVEVWGLPSGMVKALKNKAEFHEIIERTGIDGLYLPDFTITNIDEMEEDAKRFLSANVIDLYAKHNMDRYPHALMIRAAESDGNYGAAVIRQENGHKVFYPDGKRENLERCDTWEEAFSASKAYIELKTDPHKERRVVISRYADITDSPGMSVVITDGKVISLGWNGQIQKGTACVGTSAYKPKDDFSRFMQETQEKTTADGIERLLRKVAEEQQIDFASINGFANLDIMIPGPLELELQRKRYGQTLLYLAESNPRITNWTDAVQTGVAVEQLPQSISSMKRVISHGIQAEDKYEMPESVDPEKLRDKIYDLDTELNDQSGTRIIVRMPVRKTMGVIFMGDTAHARRVLTNKVEEIVEKG